MRKTIIALGLAVALAVPALAQGTSYAPKHYGAKKACRDERAADKDAFKERYANENGRHAFRRCVRQHVRHAKAVCRAERETDPEAFKEKYASDRGTEAFGRCVREHESDPIPVASDPQP
ncbi:MAG TPA: hypothetical protein VJT75_13470 [Thermoleophilaceae bacterium]|nr:hypothetical protein [Thermoleophilaceae bacterium]